MNGFRGLFDVVVLHIVNRFSPVVDMGVGWLRSETWRVVDAGLCLVVIGVRHDGVTVRVHDFNG